MERNRLKAELLRTIIDMGYKNFKELVHEIDDDLKRITSELAAPPETKEIIVSLKKDYEVLTSDGAHGTQPQQPSQPRRREKKSSA